MAEKKHVYFAVCTLWKQLYFYRRPDQLELTRKLSLTPTVKSYNLYSTLTVKRVLHEKPIDQTVRVRGWIRAIRKHKGIKFLDVDDGSCLRKLQVLLTENSIKNAEPTYGSSVEVQGTLVKTAQSGQVELQCKNLSVIGPCKVEDYPFSPRKQYPPDFVRQFLHLRPKTNTFSSLLRIRNSAMMAVHKFFQENFFYHIHTPIITSNDCEGAGEVFSVEVGSRNGNPSTVSRNTEIKPQSDKPLEKKSYFFDIPAYLTVSGQLHLEAAACGLSKVYSFGPTFRAENTRTRHHLNEFYMIEAEEAFVSSLNPIIQLAEEFYKYVCKAVMDACQEEVKLFHDKSPECREVTDKILKGSFVRMPYLEAVDILEKHAESLQNPIKCGEDLKSDHEQFLSSHCGNQPVFVTHFPASVKPFYMKQTCDSSNTVECFDLLVPFGGEVCGGSLREDNQEVLHQTLNKLKLSKSLEWYLDLRKFGSVPHGGFGMGFERMLQSILGVHNIRDVIPFPRWTHHCQM